MLVTESVEARDSCPRDEDVAIGVYGWNPWLTEGRCGMPIGWGVGAAFNLGLALITPARYCDEGLGDVADETEEESYDLVDRFGDRA